ncbi:MAG: hypothetical protein PVG07_09330 [Acidobacteriota bacterium]|jgi:hypothetical protein
MRRAIVLTVFVLAPIALIALPALAADDGIPDEACVNMTPATAQTVDTLPETTQDPLFTSEIGDPGELAGCSAWARCADGSTVSCSTNDNGASCWGLDNCYAVCDGVFHWCSYRPYPCPV